MTPYLGEIRLFGGTFAPANWHLCNGALLSISNYSALYTLIGTTYGGDGQATFAVPDLRGRFPINQGTGLGLSSYVIGQLSGSESVTLLESQIPSHSHSLIAQATPATISQPSNALLAQPEQGELLYLDPTGIAPNDVTLALDTVQPAGNTLPHDNIMPTLAATYIIALAGIFPSRN
ncbi:phage tail protein [Sphingomonas sp. ERG5]|uniref:phage tail protein n=1 Tax=Sphingomonas sp. ERG5 TaxID=1381597 RepID=UPI00054BA67A|nr:tail fiber protein [Sphingomonas sp. ERG5]